MAQTAPKRVANDDGGITGQQWEVPLIGFARVPDRSRSSVTDGG